MVKYAFMTKDGNYCKNFKGMIDNKPLRQFIEEPPPGSVILKMLLEKYKEERKIEPENISEKLKEKLNW